MRMGPAERQVATHTGLITLLIHSQMGLDLLALNKARGTGLDRKFKGYQSKPEMTPKEAKAFHPCLKSST